MTDAVIAPVTAPYFKIFHYLLKQNKDIFRGDSEE